jgi:hypothetical protein
MVFSFLCAVKWAMVCVAMRLVGWQVANGKVGWAGRLVVVGSLAGGCHSV